MNDTKLDCIDLKSRWRHQIINRRFPESVAARQSYAALAFVDQSNLQLPYIEISSLLVVAVYEDTYRRPDSTYSDCASLRLSGYRVIVTPSGVQWGGTENSVLFKDLSLAPQLNGSGQRLDIRKTELLELALKLDRGLDQAVQSLEIPQSSVRLPGLWAAYRCNAFLEHDTSSPDEVKNTNDALRCFAQRFEGLNLYPLNLVKGELGKAVTILADAKECEPIQVIRLGRLPDDLVGSSVDSQYDFYNNKFRKSPAAVQTIDGQNNTPPSDVQPSVPTANPSALR